MRQIATATLLALCPFGATAQTLDDIVQVSVLPGWDTADGVRMAGLRFDLAPGWKTYWRAPGDAGIPPLFAFAGGNIRAVTPQWPTPEVFDQGGMRAIGYTGSFVLPLAVSVNDPGAEVQLSGSVAIGVCEEVCVPVELDFAGLLPPEGPRTGAIVAAMVERPIPGTAAGIPPARCSIGATTDGLTVTAHIATPDDYDVVIEPGHAGVWTSEPDMARRGDTLLATVDMVHPEGGFALDRSAIRITLLGNGQAVDLRGCAAP